jgi:hypothetical protein
MPRNAPLGRPVIPNRSEERRQRLGTITFDPQRLAMYLSDRQSKPWQPTIEHPVLAVRDFPQLSRDGYCTMTNAIGAQPLPNFDALPMAFK